VESVLQALGQVSATAQPNYVNLSELQGQAPPEGVAWYIPEIQMLAVPADWVGEVQAAEAAIQQVAPGAKLEPSSTYHAMGGEE
jgi:hypothetical protein